jgi:hypothetical protein
VEDDFVSAETKRLDLPSGGWIEVKAELSYGEEQQIAGAGIVQTASDDENSKAETRVDLKHHNIVRLETWLVDWSMQKDGKTLPISRSTIAALKPQRAKEIDDVLTAHIKESEEKKAPTSTGAKPKPK